MIGDDRSGRWIHVGEGCVERLNVSVASAITLYVASRGRHGDLDEASRIEVLGRFLLAIVRDGDRVVSERR